MMVSFLIENIFVNPPISLKVVQTNRATRPRFIVGSDVFSTPSSTPETFASWPPRPDSTGLGLTWVAGNVVHFCRLESIPSLKHDVITPILTPMTVSEAVIVDGNVGDVGCDCLKLRPYVFQTSVTSSSQSENIISGDVWGR